METRVNASSCIQKLMATKTIQIKCNEGNAFMPNVVSGDSVYANKADILLLEKSFRIEPHAPRVGSNDIPSVSTAASISDGRPDYRE